MALPDCRSPSPIHLHGIIEPLELEGTLEGHLVQLPCNEQRQLRAGQSPIQPHLGISPGMETHHISGQPMQCLTTLIAKTSLYPV